jgi:hypothetical protein
MPKSCYPDKILNPATGRCVKKDGAIGKKILQGQRAGARPRAGAGVKKCPPSKILNPATDRCVKKNGATGRRVHEQNKKKQPKKKQPEKKQPKKKQPKKKQPEKKQPEKKQPKNAFEQQYGPNYKLPYDLRTRCHKGLCELLSSGNKHVTRKDYLKWMLKNHPDKGGNMAFAAAVNDCWDQFQAHEEQTGVKKNCNVVF